MRQKCPACAAFRLVIRLDERLLRNVLSRVMIAQNSPSRRMNLALVALNQTCISIPITSEYLADEITVRLRRSNFQRCHFKIDGTRNYFAAEILQDF